MRMRKPRGAIKFMSKKKVWWYGWPEKRKGRTVWAVKPADWPYTGAPLYVKDWLNASRQYARIRERTAEIPKPLSARPGVRMWKKVPA
jgi:hypothetical protein